MADDALALVRTCAEAMWAEDRASRALGMEIVDIAPGRATLAMTVRDSMTNGHHIATAAISSRWRIPRLPMLATAMISAPWRSIAR